MRRPVKEPGPDMKVIFSKSWKVLLCSFRWFLSVSRSFSAISLPRLSSYVKVWPDSYKVILAVKSEVSRYRLKVWCSLAIDDALGASSSEFVLVLRSQSSKLQRSVLHLADDVTSDSVR